MFNKALILSVVSLFSLNLHADEVKKEVNHPCQKIKSACESAGFIKGDHKEKKGLFKDCLKPILEGKEVAGVTVTQEDIASCKEKKAQHKSKK